MITRKYAIQTQCFYHVLFNHKLYDSEPYDSIVYFTVHKIEWWHSEKVRL